MGNYGWSESGWDPTDSPPSSWTEVALVHFDGNGNFSSPGHQIYDIENGIPDPDSGTTNSNFTEGTYTVNSDCTMEITYTWEGNTYHDHGVVVGANGSEVTADEYGPDTSPNLTTGHVDIKQIQGSE
jgi:hypothetical protein